MTIQHLRITLYILVDEKCSGVADVLKRSVGLVIVKLAEIHPMNGSYHFVARRKKEGKDQTAILMQQFL